MPLTSWDFFDEERHHQVAALHPPPPAGTGTGTGLYHDYQHHHPHNSQHHQSSRNSLWNNCTGGTIQSGGQDSLLGVTLLDFERLCRSQVVSHRMGVVSLQHDIQFPTGGASNISDQSLQQASPETLISEVLEDIESLFDDDEAPSSQRAQVAAPRRTGAVNQWQQQTRHCVNPSSPSGLLYTWQREDPSISGMVSTRNLPSSLVPTKVATVRTNTQGHQQASLVDKKCLKRTGFEFSNCSPSSNARVDAGAAHMAEKHFPITKKSRYYIPLAVDDNKSEGASMSEDRRFRSYQTEQWAETFTELCAFRKEKGHCQVPHRYAKNPSLARWVKRQRYQHKLKIEGKPSTTTVERIDQLEKIGFIWDSHSSAWEERFNELRVFRERAGHCNVPSNFPDNPSFATWVKCQRRQYKLFWQGKTSNINLHRIEQLHEIGFEWVLRGPGKTSSQQF